MDNNLAIVIPAFKPDFLDLALNSIGLQTNKKFTVYIGDDNSPYDLYSIIKKYLDIFDIVYKKFDQNFGSNNLINQWHRCVELTDNEEWIWLFSDDDLMDVECVSSFYNTLNNIPSRYDLYRFNTNMIDAKGGLLYQNPTFERITSSYEFANKKLRGEIRSFVSEYIFSRSVYIKCNGFVEFPLAWASDDATWIKFGYKKGIYTISNHKVSWRLSDINISNATNSHGNKKCVALIEYSNWLLNFFNGKYDLAETKQNLKLFFLNQFNHYNIVLKPTFVYYLFKELKATFNISYFQFTIFLIRNKILNR